MLRWCSAKQLGGCREVILISLEARAKTDMVARGTFRKLTPRVRKEGYIHPVYYKYQLGNGTKTLHYICLC